jgi:hypothetical protein
VSDVLVLLLRPDKQDFQGAAVTVDVARRLQVLELLMVVNKIPARIDLDSVAAEVTAAYDVEVAGVLPLSEDVAANGSGGLFSFLFPIIRGRKRSVAWHRACSPRCRCRDSLRPRRARPLRRRVLGAGAGSRRAGASGVVRRARSDERRTGRPSSIPSEHSSSWSKPRRFQTTTPPRFER